MSTSCSNSGGGKQPRAVQSSEYLKYAIAYQSTSVSVWDEEITFSRRLLESLDHIKKPLENFLLTTVVQRVLNCSNDAFAVSIAVLLMTGSIFSFEEATSSSHSQSSEWNKVLSRAMIRRQPSPVTQSKTPRPPM